MQAASHCWRLRSGRCHVADGPIQILTRRCTKCWGHGYGLARFASTNQHLLDKTFTVFQLSNRKTKSVGPSRRQVLDALDIGRAPDSEESWDEMPTQELPSWTLQQQRLRLIDMLRRPSDRSSSSAHVTQKLRPMGQKATHIACMVDCKDVVSLGVVDDVGHELDASCILPRNGCFLFALGPIKAIVYVDEAYIFGADNCEVSRVIHEIVASMRRTCDEDTYFGGSRDPFELYFLEATLEVVSKRIGHHVRLLSTIAETFVRRVQLAPPSTVLDELVHAQSLLDELAQIEGQIQQFNRCITDMVNSDEDMSAILLSARENGRETHQDSADHDEVELILEAAHRNFKRSLLEVERFSKNIRFAWALSDLKLASYRAQLDLANVQVSVAGLSLGLCAAVAGFFGMNVPVPFAESPAAFNAIVGCCLATGGVIIGRFWYALSHKVSNDGRSQQLSNAFATKSVLGDIMQVQRIVHTRGFKSAASVNDADMRNLLEEALSRPVSDAEVLRVREFIPLLSRENSEVNATAGESFGLHNPEDVKT